MKQFALFALLLCALPMRATTHYIRPVDGGTSVTCTGLVNDPDPGSGSAQPCALASIMYLLTDNTTSAAFAWTTSANDTIQYGQMGNDYIGQGGINGLGIVWQYCTGAGGANCDFPQMPNGTAILGFNHGNCANPFTSANRLIGLDGIFYMIPLDRTSSPDLQCLLLTQPDTCTLVAHTGQCIPGTNNYVQHGIEFAYQTAQGPDNFVIQDVAVVGMSGECFLGSHLNKSSGDVSNMTNIYAIGCGDAGIDGDGGGCGTSCESIGTLNYSGLDIEWNGCVAVKPFTTQASITYNYCYDDSSLGYGDGFVQIAAGKRHALNVTHSKFKFNTQDGFDALHLGDDLTHAPIVNISSSWAEGNMGQSFKIGTGASSTAINNVSIVNCRVMKTAGNFPSNPSGWNAGLSDFCRAAGDQWAFQMNNGSTITLENNSSFGYGATMYDVACASGGTCTTGVAFVFKNNLSFGYGDPGMGGVLPGAFNIGTSGNPFTNSGGGADHNNWFSMRTTSCPVIASETNCTYLDPLVVAESNVNAINPNLTASSPLIGAGTTPCPSTDYNGNGQTSPCTIGKRLCISAWPPVTNVQIGGSIKLSGSVSIQ